MSVFDQFHKKATFECQEQYMVEHEAVLYKMTVISVTRKCVRVKFDDQEEKWMYIDQFEAELPNLPEYKIVERLC